MPYRWAKKREAVALDESPCLSGAQVGSASVGLTFPLLGLSVPGTLACCPWAGHVPSGQFGWRHRGDLMPLLLQCGLSALCDVVPERESTALVRRGVAENGEIFVRTSAFLLLLT